jgi:hypothetical protein
MFRAVPLILLLCLAPFLPVPKAAAAELNYSLYVVGLPLADATLNLDLAAPAYRARLRFHTVGVAELFVGDRLDEHTSGRFESDRPAPIEYLSSGRQHGTDRVVGMTWHDGTPVVTTITPPNGTEREEVPAALLPHTMNPLDAVVMLLQLVARTGHCEGSSRAYDGRRLQLLEARTTGEEDIPPSARSSFSGRALRCDFTDKTLAGFRIGTGRDDDMREHHGTVWLAKISPASQKLPVRVSVETRWFGDATIYLTSASP